MRAELSGDRGKEYGRKRRDGAVRGWRGREWCLKSGLVVSN